MAVITEECRYVWTDEDGNKREITEDEVPTCCDIGTVIKIIRHGNGKVAIYNAYGDDLILEI